MDMILQLKTIQTVSGMTQTEIANKIGISFVALNNIFTGQSLPRQKTKEAIHELYAAITGTRRIPTNELRAKKQAVTIKTRKNIVILQKLYR